MSDAPAGTITLLFTDIEGSTRMWEDHPDSMAIALSRHDDLVRGAVETNGGVVFKTIGDAFCAVFRSPGDALLAAVQAQVDLSEESWPDPLSIRVRMGIHTGTVQHRDNDYFGPPVNRVARLMSIGHGGQVLVSGATREIVLDHLPPPIQLTEMGSHRLKDMGRPEDVYQLAHPGLGTSFPPLRSLNNPNMPNNLPQQVSTFIGRETEVAAVRRLLGTTRILTLTATGGTGKTRLSLQAAAEVLDQYPDGAWFVELGAVTDQQGIGQLIARLVGVPEAPGEPILRTLTAALQSRKMLLILDNCEHLIDACAEAAGTIVRACGQVTILASSREPMNISGETVYPIPPLSLPDNRRHTPASVMQFESARLFMERAAAVRHDFALSNDSATALGQLCRRLDGIPLALELAAARIRSLTVEEINQRLDNRFRLLTGGSRNALPRQQTLRALIDWSYDLLNEQERVLLRRLAVFAGGWTLEAAEQICRGGAIEDWEILDLLTALSDKSLVVCDSDGSAVRYRLLETLREYSNEKLIASEDAAEIGRNHAAHYASKASDYATSGNRDEGVVWLGTESDNVRAALARLWCDGEDDRAATLVTRLRWFWSRKGWIREACAQLDHAVTVVDNLNDGNLRAVVLKDSGWFAFMLGDYVTADARSAAAVTAAIAAGAPELQAHALNGVALVAQSRGDLDRAETLFLEAIAILRHCGADAILADYLTNLGFLEATRDKHDSARALFEEAREIYSKQSDEVSMAAWLCNQSDLALRQTVWQEAQTLAEQSLSLFRRIDHRIGIATALANLAEAAVRLQDYVLCRRSLREAADISIETQYLDLLPVLFTTLVSAMEESGRISDALLLLDGCDKLRRLLNVRQTAAEISAAANIRDRIVEFGAVTAEDSRLHMASLSQDDLISCLMAMDW